MARSWSHSRASGLAAAGAAVALLLTDASAYLGGESGAYLRVPVGASAVAMGGADVASPEYLAAWWNPAMLSVYRTSRASVGMGVRSMGRMDGFGSFDFRIPPRVGVGFALLYRGDPFLNDLHDANEKPVEGGSYTTLTIKTGVSYFISRRWSAGIGLGIYYQSLPTAITSTGSLRTSSVTGIGGFSLALRWQPLDNWSLALMARSLGLTMDWSFENADGENGGQATDKVPPEFVLASRHEGHLAGKAFVWTTDLVANAFDGEWNALPHPEAAWHNGFEWSCWETFHVRLGLGDLTLNGKLTSDPSAYFSELSPRITAGFAWHVKRLTNGLWVNYALTTDRLWEGLDQVLDITYTFPGTRKPQEPKP